MFMEERYFWYYENNTDKHFRAKFNFVLQNLEIEDLSQACEDGTSWGVSLLPGEFALRHFSRVNPAEEAKYKTSYSYSLTPI